MSYQHKLAVQLESEKFMMISRINKLCSGLRNEDITLIIAPLNATNEDFKVYVCDGRTFKILGYLIVTTAAMVHFKTCAELMKYQKIFASTFTESPLQLLKASRHMEKLAYNPPKSTQSKNEVTELYKANWSQEHESEKFKKTLNNGVQQELKSVLYEKKSLKSTINQPIKTIFNGKTRLISGEAKKTVQVKEHKNDAVEKVLSCESVELIKEPQIEKAQTKKSKMSEQKTQQAIQLTEDVKVLFLSSNFTEEDFLENNLVPDLSLISANTKTKDEDGEYVMIICDAEKYFHEQHYPYEGSSLQEVVSKSAQCMPITERPHFETSTKIDNDLNTVFTKGIQLSASNTSLKTLGKNSVKKCRFDGCTQTEQDEERQNNLRYVAPENFGNVPENLFSLLESNKVSSSQDSLNDMQVKNQKHNEVSIKHVKWANSECNLSAQSSKTNSGADSFKDKLNSANLSAEKDTQLTNFDADFFQYKLSKIFSESSNDYVLGVFTAGSESLAITESN